MSTSLHLCRHLRHGQAFPCRAGHGGSSDGGPGPRPHYDPEYYAAFVRDPGGSNLGAFTQAT
jgi:hypothetical protein